MTPIDTAMHDVMKNDGALTALLAQYRGSLAIFFQSPIPEGVLPPYIAVPPETDTPNDTKNGLGRTAIRDIGCYDVASGDPRTVDAIAERVRALFHRQPLTIVGYETMLAEVIGPSPASTDKTLYGRLLSLRLVVWEA